MACILVIIHIHSPNTTQFLTHNRNQHNKTILVSKPIHLPTIGSFSPASILITHVPISMQNGYIGTVSIKASYPKCRLLQVGRVQQCHPPLQIFLAPFQSTTVDSLLSISLDSILFFLLNLPIVPKSCRPPWLMFGCSCRCEAQPR